MKRINFSGRKILWMLFFPLTTIFMTDNAFAADPPQAEYEAALAEITDGSYYLVTEVNGTKFYITQNGYLTDDKEMAYLFDISKVNASAANDKLFDVAFNIDPRNGAHFSNTTLINGKAALNYGAYRQDRGNNRDDWERQIFYLNAEGKYAIRSCNTIYGENSWNDAGRAFWTWEIENPDAYYPVPCYSYDPAYIWSLELPADSKEEIYVVLEQILTTYEQQLYDNVDEPTSVKMYSGGGPGYGTLADWETWRNFKAELYRLDTLWLKFLDDDYNPLSDPDCPNLDGVTAWKAKLDSMWLQILDSEIPYKIPKDGYYRIMTRMRYYTDTDIKDVETGEVVDIERSYANKALLASYDKNYPNEALWGTLKKQSANFIWKLTQVGDSILMQNVGMENYVSMASSDRLMLTTDNAQISHVVFDYAANGIVDLKDNYADLKDIFYIRLANQPRHSGRYVHQLDHNRGKDSYMDLELCFWNETYGYGEPYTTDGGTSEWYLEPVSEDEVAELAEKFVPIREHAVLVQKNQKLRDEVRQTIFTKILTAATLGSPHSDSLEGNLNNLIDGDKSTFWHSDWHGETPEGMYIGLTSEEIGYHYLLLSGVENMVGECELYLCQRNSKNDHPKTIYLFGSNDALAPDNAWIQMAVIEVPNVGPGEENTIPFTIKTAYPYVRFVVTDCLGASYPFRVIWHAAEIQITAKNNIFNFLDEISTNLERIYNENCAVSDEDVTIQLYEELEAAFNHYLNKIKETETNISFVDANVKALCISNWDINGDGELSYGESAAVKSLGDVFKGNTAIKSFDELQYFTNLTSINISAFNLCYNLKSIKIPKSVVSIGSKAFIGCSNLTSITIPEGVTSIGGYAFSWCSGLTSVTIPEGVTYIGHYAFANCSGLTSITIPEGVTYISDYTFEFCSGITSISIPSSVTYIYPYAFRGCSNLTSITIPEGVTSIGSYAFSDCSNLIAITIPEGVTSIGNYAFSGCSNLIAITIPEGVTSIGNYAFSGCSSLKSIECESYFPIIYILAETFSDNVYSSATLYVPTGAKGMYQTADVWKQFTSIIEKEIEGVDREYFEYTVTGDNSVSVKAKTNRLMGKIEIPSEVSIDGKVYQVTSIANFGFEWCKKITSVVLPNTIKNIGHSAFEYCASLKNITMPESLTEIDTYAFYGCSNLEQFNIPQNLNSFGFGALSGDCNQLKEITVADGNTSFKVENGLLLNIDGTSAFAYAFGNETEHLVIPETVTWLQYTLFEGDKRLKTIKVPAGVTLIGDNTFMDCTALEEVMLPDDIKTISFNAFRNCKSLQKVTIPTALMEVSDDIFSGCTAIRSVIVRQEKPLAIKQSFFPNEVYTNATLYIPKGLRAYFVNATGWKEFQRIEEVEMDGVETSDIYISQHIEYTDSLISNDPLFALRPDIKLHYFSDDVNVRGHLTVDEGTTLSLGKFVQSANWGSMNDGSKYTKAGVEYYHPTTLQNDGFMRADSVIVKQSLYRDRWHFISFPFNVNVSDIKAPNGTYWALRRYDGEARATGQMNDTWQNLRQGEQMEAGCGYIIQLTREGADKTSELIFKAQNDPKKNNIFTTDDVTTPLEEHPSEFVHNRSWNLVGNPYPSFFDTRYIEQDGTIIVWNGNGYTAYSLVDDNYILMPFEAFFIQKPLNADALKFSRDGRQHTHEIFQRTSSPRQAKSLQNRRFLNFTITDGVDTDRSRVVLNEQALIGYETDKDAPKFMEARPNMPQLFSVESGVQYSINERPMGDGQIVFSLYAPVDGEYHFSVDGDATNMMVLDTETGASWALADGDYVFAATEGMHNARLVVSLTGKTTDIAQINAYDDGELKVADGQLSLCYISDKHIKVLSLDGRLLYNDTASHITINVSHGVYLVDIDGKTIKIMVK